MIDYKKLLKDYMELVLSREGCDFLDRHDAQGFTDEEHAELLRMSDELDY